MKRNIARFLLTLLLVCFTATVVGKGYNPHARPFMGSMSGEATFDFTTGACLDVTGAPWQSIGSMAGNLTHLGQAEWYVSHCSTPDGMRLVNGEGTLVAANGDEIWMTYTAELISHDEFPPLPAVLVYAQVNIVTGGSGRFEGASGEFLSLIFVTIEDLTVLTTPVDVQFAGNIIY